MNAKYIEEQLEKSVLPTLKERHLIGLSTEGRATDDIICELTDGIDLNTSNREYLLLLSAIGFTNKWEGFPAETVPMLKGLHRRQQAHIVMKTPWLIKQLRLLTDNGIPVMILKGGAILSYYATQRPRYMSDYDIAVPEKQFDAALRLVSGNGNTVDMECAHSVSILGERNGDEIDLHRLIFKMGTEQGTDIWERAVKFDFHGVNVCVPCAEDMFIHVLDNQSRNYFRDEHSWRRVQWLLDCYDIWKVSGGLDLKYLAGRAAQFHVVPRVRMMLRLFAMCFPDIISMDEFERYFPHTPEYDALLVNGEKFRKAFTDYVDNGYDKMEEGSFAKFKCIFTLKTSEYRYLKHEIKSRNPHAGFLSYLKDEYHVEGFSKIMNKLFMAVQETD